MKIKITKDDVGKFCTVLKDRFCHVNLIKKISNKTIEVGGNYAWRESKNNILFVGAEQECESVQEKFYNLEREAEKWLESKIQELKGEGYE